MFSIASSLILAIASLQVSADLPDLGSDQYWNSLTDIEIQLILESGDEGDDPPTYHCNLYDCEVLFDALQVAFLERIAAEQDYHAAVDDHLSCLVSDPNGCEAERLEQHRAWLAWKSASFKYDGLRDIYSHCFPNGCG